MEKYIGSRHFIISCISFSRFNLAQTHIDYTVYNLQIIMKRTIVKQSYNIAREL